MRSEEVLVAALDLEQTERAALVVRLLESLALPIADGEVERAWVAELDRRAQRVLEYGPSGSDGDEVFARVRRSVTGR